MNKTTTVFYAVLVLLLCLAMGGRVALIATEGNRGIILDEPAVPLSGIMPEAADATLTGDYGLEVARLINEARQQEGLSIFGTDEPLSAAAQARALELLEVFSHSRPDGSSYKTVLSEYGVSSRKSGENIASGYVSPEQVVQGWMGSEGHRANILGDYSKLGVGVVQLRSNGYAWVLLFI